MKKIYLSILYMSLAALALLADDMTLTADTPLTADTVATDTLLTADTLSADMLHTLDTTLVADSLAPDTAAVPLIARGGIGVRALDVTKADRLLTLGMTFDLSGLDLHPNRYVTLTPRITDGVTDTLVLRPLVVSGRRQHIMYERERHRLPEYEEAEELRFRPRRDQQVPYRAVVPFARWMHGATLFVDEEWCGCGGEAEERRENDLMLLDLLPPVYRVQPLLAYVEPQAEAVKTRTETGTAYLDFRVNRTLIDSAYRNNAAELAKIRATIERVQRDSDLTIEHITIHGYASPEGSYANNARLAAARTRALEEYVLGLYGFDEQFITIDSTPEDWAGLRLLIEESSLSARDELLTLIDSTANADLRERLLARVGGGEAYRYMLREWYPSLRHSDYTIRYTIRGFDVEEAKRLIKTRPQKLSLHEMYVVAGEYEPGSDDFDQVFDVAVRMYPEDPIANLNAANIAIADGVYDKAGAYLQKAGDTPEAIHARGVLALLLGDYDRARFLLDQACKLGVEAADHNLRELQKKVENEKELTINN